MPTPKIKEKALVHIWNKKNIYSTFVSILTRIITNIKSATILCLSAALLLCTHVAAYAAVEEVSIIREDCTGYDNCFTSLAQWVDDKKEDLAAADKIAVARIEGAWESPDTGKVQIRDWPTTADNYIKIYTAPEARHNGSWNETAYRLVVDTDSWPRMPLYIDEADVIVEGLQVANAGNDDKGDGIQINGDGQVTISDSIVRMTGTDARTAIGVNGPVTAFLYNNIVYDFSNSGIRVDNSGATVYVYNNTVENISGVSWAAGIYARDGRVVAKNNLVQDALGDDYNGSFDSGSDHNLSSDDSNTDGENDVTNAVVTFIDRALNNFHLDVSDTMARNAGMNLSAEFSNDIDGELRKGAWDIGADDVVDTTAPEIHEVTPITTPTNNSSPEYVFYSSEAGVMSSSCSSQTFDAVEGENTFRFENLSDGTYSDCTITVTDADGNVSLSLAVPQFTIDTTLDLTPPVIVSHQPGPQVPEGTTEISITIQTDEPALCRIATEPDRNFEDMADMVSNGNEHSYHITGLNDLMTYNYYIKCQDDSPQQNITAQDYIVSFQVKNDPGTIISDHPRIWLTPQRIQRLKQDAQNETDKFVRLRDNVNRESDGMRHLTVINNLLMYVVWHDDPDESKRTVAEQRAQRAMEITDGLIAQRYGDRNKAGFYMLAVALVYDWLYDHEDFQSRKQDYVNWFQLTTNPDEWLGRSQYYTAFGRDGQCYEQNKDQSWHNYHALGLLTLYVCGASTYGDNPDAQDWIDQALDWYDNTREGLDFNGDGGGSPEDDHYWSASINYLGKFLHAVLSASGADLSKEIPHYEDRLSYARFVSWPRSTSWYGQPAWNYVYHGDANTHINALNHRQRISQWMLIDLFPEKTEAKYLQSFLTQSPVTGTYNSKFSGEEFLWAVDDRESIHYNQSSLSHLAAGTGRVFARQDWTEDATHLELQCGDHFEFHQHYAQGHFGLFKNEALITDAGKYDSTANEHARNYHYRTIAHNTLLVYDGREGAGDTEGGVWTEMRGSKDGVNDGGQLVSAVYDENGQLIKRAAESVFTVSDWYAAGENDAGEPVQNVYDSGEINHFEDNGDWVYIQADASKAYHPWKVSHFDRSFVYLRNIDGLVIFDRASVPNSANKKRILFHLQGEPIIPGTGVKLHGLDNSYGGVWSYDNTSTMEMTYNQARLFYKALLPQSVDIAKIGGPDSQGVLDSPDSFDYWVPSDGNDLSQGGINWETDPIDRDAKDEKEYGPWRIEVSPSVASVDDMFLHVLFPRDADVSQAPSTELISSSGNTMSGALIDKESNPHIILFSNDSSGALVDSVSYSIDFPDQLTCRHIVTGIQSGTYAIYVDGTIVETLSVSSENTLAFETIGGSAFSIGEPSFQPDIDGDGDVDGLDLASLIVQGEVDTTELSAFANAFGQ